MRSLLYILSAFLFAALAGTATAGHCAHVNGFGYSRGFSSPLVLNSFRTYQTYQPPVALVPSVSLGNYGGVSSCSDGGLSLNAATYNASPVIVADPNAVYGNVQTFRTFRAFNSGYYGHNDVLAIDNGHVYHQHADVQFRDVQRNDPGIVGTAVNAVRDIVGKVLGGPRGGPQANAQANGFLAGFVTARALPGKGGRFKK